MKVVLAVLIASLFVIAGCGAKQTEVAPEPETEPIAAMDFESDEAADDTEAVADDEMAMDEETGEETEEETEEETVQE